MNKIIKACALTLSLSLIISSLAGCGKQKALLNPVEDAEAAPIVTITIDEPAVEEGAQSKEATYIAKSPASDYTVITETPEGKELLSIGQVNDTLFFKTQNEEASGKIIVNKNYAVSLFAGIDEDGEYHEKKEKYDISSFSEDENSSVNIDNFLSQYTVKVYEVLSEIGKDTDGDAVECIAKIGNSASEVYSAVIDEETKEVKKIKYKNTAGIDYILRYEQASKEDVDMSSFEDADEKDPEDFIWTWMSLLLMSATDGSDAHLEISLTNEDINNALKEQLLNEKGHAYKIATFTFDESEDVGDAIYEKYNQNMSIGSSALIDCDSTSFSVLYLSELEIADYIAELTELGAKNVKKLNTTGRQYEVPVSANSKEEIEAFVKETGFECRNGYSIITNEEDSDAIIGTASFEFNRIDEADAIALDEYFKDKVKIIF